MADSHAAGPEDQAPSTISWVLKLTATLVLAFAPLLLVFVGPSIVRAAGRWLGWTLKQKTDGRRALLVSLMDGENKKSSEKSNLETKSTSSGEWQNVQEFDLEGAERANKDWAGIVGFFHPFWFVKPSLLGALVTRACG